MLPFLTKGARLEVNALFIQPTRWCSLNCPGCYVKDHIGGEDSYHTPEDEQFKLFQKFFEGKEAWANQITISVDNLPTGSSAVDIARKVHMLRLFEDILNYINHIRFDNYTKPEIHMTFNGAYVLLDYLTHTLTTSLTTYTQVIKNINVISVSNICNTEIIKNLTENNIHVNYNHTIPENVSSSNIDKHVEKMIEIGKIVNSIYFIVKKDPHGQQQEKLVQVGKKYRMSSTLNYIDTMMWRLPRDIKRKINVDSCIQDTYKYHQTGFGCSANVSKFQVWPDGSVSGCPYAFSGNTPPGRTAMDILDNIRKAQEQYDFEKCHLPTLIDPVYSR